MPRQPRLDRRQLLAGSVLATVGGGAAAAFAQQELKNRPDLSGKSILITGCSSGFGHLGALHYSRLGARTIASMRDMPRPEAETLRETARAENLDLHIVEIDVRDDGQVADGVALAEKIAGGALDVLVNNAGIGLSGPVEIQDIDAARHIFDTNALGYHRMARAVLPAMRAAGSGLIFNVSSQLGRVIFPSISLYSATKFAVEAMSEQMAYELAPRGVEVCIIQPGGYPTEIWENGNRYTQALLDRIDDERKSAYAALIEATALRGGGGDTDPMDVPRAIAEIIAMEPGTRPLRRAVHPGRKPQQPINEVSARVQMAMMERSPYAAWAKDVLG